MGYKETDTLEILWVHVGLLYFMKFFNAISVKMSKISCVYISCIVPTYQLVLGDTASDLTYVPF